MVQVVCLQLWIRVVLVLVVKGALTEQRFAIEPQDQTAIIGSRVTLPCRVINKVGALQWTKDDFALGTHRSLTEFFRYAMIGSDEEGDFSLAIEPVTLDDDAKYQCQVSSGPRGEPAIRSRFAKLTVLVPPEKPRIVQGSSLETTEDGEIHLECISYGGKPPAEITWIDGLGNVISNGIRYITEQIPESRLYVAKSVVKIMPKREHHNTTFVCQAQNQADRTFQSAKIKLYVRYAPKVTVRIAAGGSGNGDILHEGGEAKLICEADANPPEVSYRWYINQQQVIPSERSITELIITNITRRQHDSIVKCEARNLVGKSEDSQTLDVNYSPKFRQKPRSVQADVGSVVNLVCDVDGNPPPDITWIHGMDKIVGKSVNLSITVTQETVGKYFCRAHVPGFSDIGAEATVKMKKRPTIIKDETHFGVPGDTVRLECLAYSVPPAEKTIWSFSGREIGHDHRDYAVLDVPLPEGIKSTLVIKESREEHYGVYNCTVTNQYGTDVAEIQLKQRRNFPLSLMLVGGSLACILMVITIIMVVILCQKKEKKPLQDMTKHVEKQCKEPSDKSSCNISEMKLEMKTGSSGSNINCESDYGAGRDNDSIITRVAVPLAGPVPIDQRYSSTNRYSAPDYGDSACPIKQDVKCNNGYVPYVDYSKDYTLSVTSTTKNNSPSVVATSSCISSPSGSSSVIDPRYSATYGNPYLRTTHSPSLPPPPLGQPPPPPPYNSLRNGSVPQLPSAAAPKLSNNHLISISPSSSSSSSSQYVTLTNHNKQVVTRSATHATHV